MTNKISKNNVVLHRKGFTISIAQHKEKDSRMHGGERTIVQEIAFWKDDWARGEMEIVHFGTSSTSFLRSLQEVFDQIDQLAKENDT